VTKPAGHLSRTPPLNVRRELRREVGFGCPAVGCGSPYLEYHHFDPTWAVKEHHKPKGMIALCAEHHAKAAAWTTEQLRAMKSVPQDRDDIHGRFEWMRDEILARVGGNFYYDTLNIFVWKGKKVIWFERDSDQRLLLNLNLPTVSGLSRTRLENNDWIVEGEPVEVESPPNGSELRVKYINGDKISVKFHEWHDAEALYERFPITSSLKNYLHMPLVMIDIELAVPGTNVNFDSDSTTLPGLVNLTRCIFIGLSNALVFD
jgi:hypothetical protein